MTPIRGMADPCGLPAGTRVTDHYLDSYRQVFLNVLRTQLGRRGMDSGVEGCLHLAQSVNLKQLLPMADSQLSPAENDFLEGGMARIGSELGGQLGFNKTMSKIGHALSRNSSVPDARVQSTTQSTAHLPGRRSLRQDSHALRQDSQSHARHPDDQV